MENNKKWIISSYLAGALLLVFSLYKILIQIAIATNLSLRYEYVDQIVIGISVVVAIVAFVILSNHKKANEYMSEVVIELQKVSWSTSKEISASTIVVLIFVIILGFLFGAFDLIWAYAINKII